MRTRNCKLALLALFGSAAALYVFTGRPAAAFSAGPLASHTGAPGELTCAVATGCHDTNAINSGGGTLTLTGLPESGYTANQEYTLTVTLAQAPVQPPPPPPRYGFQATILNDAGALAGEIILLDANRTQLNPASGTTPVNNQPRRYINHRSEGITPNGTNQNSWQFRWKAPAASTGRVTFYVAGNAANGNLARTGDFIYTISRSVQPAGAAVATVSAASFALNSALTPETISALFGSNLAASTVSAPGLPLPTTLGGLRVRLRDAAGMERDAPLFFVSPLQINLLIPAGTASGAASLTVVNNNNNTIGQGAVNIESVSPGLFAANANGLGVAAAVAQRISANGQSSFVSVFQGNALTGRFEAVPIDLGAPTDQVFLIIFGTGFRARSSLTNASVTLGGATAQLSFLGAQGSLVGLDQGNLLIPRSLAGRGNVDMVLRVDGKQANTVSINIR